MPAPVHSRLNLNTAHFSVGQRLALAAASHAARVEAGWEPNATYSLHRGAGNSALGSPLGTALAA